MNVSARFVLLTRFGVRPYVDSPTPATDWLMQRLELFKQTLLPSVLEQTQPFDEWVLLVDDGCPESIVQALNDLVTKANGSVRYIHGPWSKHVVANFLSSESVAPESDYVVTTRIDSDDVIHRLFSSSLREFVMKLVSGGSFQVPMFLNFTNGLQLDWTSRQVFFRDDPANAFISAVEQEGAAKSVFMEEHQRLHLMGEVRQISTRHPMWMQVVHGGNLANSISGIPARREAARGFPAHVAVAADPPELSLLMSRTKQVLRLAWRTVRSPSRLRWAAQVLKGRLWVPHPRPHSVFFTASLPAYRRAFIECLRQTLGGQLEIWCGPSLLGGHVQTDIPADSYLPLKHLELFGGRALWAYGGLTRAFRAERVIIDLNPRFLSNWVIIVTRRMMFRRTLTWGHAYPRAGSGARTVSLRAFMRSLAGGPTIVYTQAQREDLLIDGMQPADVFVAPNSAVRRDDVGFVSDNEERVGIIYSGRLDVDKEVALLIEAFADAKAHRAELRLDVIGVGAEEPLLRSLARSRGLTERDVIFHGKVFDVASLRRIYTGAIASASPGYVGLNLFQSLTFGVPMIMSDHPLNAPESAYGRRPNAAIYFERGSRVSLSRAIRSVSANATEAHGEELARWVKRTFTAEQMAEGFVNALRSS